MPVAFELARRLRKAPRAIAQDLAAGLGAIEGVARVEAAPNGYLNVFLDRSSFLQARLQPAGERPPAAGKVIVEHTAINPNKAAHIGHLRNATLGDTLVRSLRFLGQPIPDPEDENAEPAPFDPGLGLDPAFAVDVVTQVGNYGEIYDRTVGPATALGLARGVNAQWTDGGLLYAPPYR